MLPGAVSVESLVSVLGFSRRHAEVAVLVSNGATNGEIADKLGISPNTVGTYVQRLFRKLGVNRRSLVLVAVWRRLQERGFQPPP